MVIWMMVDKEGSLWLCDKERLDDGKKKLWLGFPEYFLKATSEISNAKDAKAIAEKLHLKIEKWYKMELRLFPMG
jgi:hypothetical protein